MHVKGVNHIFDAFGEGMRNMLTFSHDRLDWTAFYVVSWW
ncbi:hypothetical protein D083_4118 [Dickeya solani RNS 08.23.3.1.A]|nr:hypothetical protein D083_4118 [Dickeya solani RNS 08.23.3.1.A]